MSFKYFKKITLRLKRDKEWVTSLVLAVALTGLAYLDGTFFDHQILFWGWIIIAILLFFVVYYFMVVAGYVVLKSLFFLGAELTLLIFIAQSYCGIEYIGRTAESDSALNALLTIGGIYILYLFVVSLKKAVLGYHERMKSGALLEKAFATLAFFAAVTYFFWILAQVISPVFLDLCIYRP